MALNTIQSISPEKETFEKHELLPIIESQVFGNMQELVTKLQILDSAKFKEIADDISFFFQILQKW